MPDEETQRKQLYELLMEAGKLIDDAADCVYAAQGPNLTKAECAEVWFPTQQALRKLQQVQDQVEPVKVVK